MKDGLKWVWTRMPCAVMWLGVVKPSGDIFSGASFEDDDNSDLSPLNIYRRQVERGSVPLSQPISE